MKTFLLEVLICPACLPDEIRLEEKIVAFRKDDILEGGLHCAGCKRVYPIRNGVACLDPNACSNNGHSGNKYETAPVVSAYLWSHYADILNEENASDAYRRWADLMRPHSGIAVDAGAAVGRFTFEMGQKSDFAIGLDNSQAFIETARELMTGRCMKVALKQEGCLTRDVNLTLPPAWKTETVEFIVADALALPFRANRVASLSSLNLIDKVPLPLLHLAEMNRVTTDIGAQFLLSDPFSWSEEAAREEDWLGGKLSGPYAGKGLDNVRALLSGDDHKLPPKWKLETHGHVWWKIRTHANHFEEIRSCYIKVRR